jgi:putative colanic acid biosynthesis acetyltransferase WcaF
MYNQDTFTGPSFSLKNRLARVIWGITYFILFKYSPKPLHSWRSFVLRCFGAKIGKGVHVYPKVIIWAPWNIEIGDETGIANGVMLYSQGKILIGNRVVISQGTHLCTGTHDYTKMGFPLYTRPIKIGSYAWLAAEVFVHPGVEINKGCVIGARSVVTKDTPKWMVCAGNPCLAIKERILEKNS